MVYGLIREAPHDIAYYWRSVLLTFEVQTLAPEQVHRMGAWEDFGLMSLTFFSTLLWSVEVGIIVSVALSVCRYEVRLRWSNGPNCQSSAPPSRPKLVENIHQDSGQKATALDHPYPHLTA